MSSKNLNMKKYWENQSKHFLNTDQEGFGAVIYSGMPIWFNAFYDRYQIKSFTRLVGDLKLKDKKALDIGCGVGRWCFQLKRLGASATGIDFELERLKKARSNPNMKDIKFMNMSATNLSFKDESFHLSNSITVLHHIPYEEKKLAKIEWLILRIAIAISYPLEAICVKFVPPQFAQQGGLLFIKE
jgi:2-polyprenyl-3-methyl-5-hydroxy-6-metoxy-1,4-benzoquinol methylase